MEDSADDQDPESDQHKRGRTALHLQHLQTKANIPSNVNNRDNPADSIVDADAENTCRD